MRPGRLRPARLGPGDVVRVGGAGLRARPLRVFLSALGIAIGIAAMLAVVGVSASSREDLDRKLAALGTNLLTVSPGQTLLGESSHLPDEAIGMINRIAPVTGVSATGATNARIYRNDHVTASQTGGITVLAARLDLPATVGATVASGAWLNGATERYPAVVLGTRAADRLGVAAAAAESEVYLGGRWFTVVGVLNEVPLAPELDTAALVGWPVAVDRLGFDGYPTTVYTRTEESAVEAVQAVLAATANPGHPNEVRVSRPSDVLEAKQATDDTLNALVLGLGAVALLVGGVGVANTMFISVLERRAEIGLRRALGASPRADPHPVPRRVAAAVHAGRRRWGTAGGRGHRGLRRVRGVAVGRTRVGGVRRRRRDAGHRRAGRNLPGCAGRAARTHGGAGRTMSARAGGPAGR